ncbi:hypothetical protein LTR91_020860 [Friedmanniomyces endolithicus]|uniref:Pleckstrin homology domain-containing protein n=1 Tax=Friedmanniomyces endolithicus TaxID=329885 RepID=A0AAN6K0R2_9PEZI|nr:hypothetical protein LTR91_020860 [Friedmanniomyces endolithicus]
MADYFSEYATFVGSKGLPSPVDTPYETPGYIRSKRSSRATATSSREQSASPPPLPPDAIDFTDKSRDGRYSALDPRRFTPTLHASLVSEILNLRRELDSKNSLVENLETHLSDTKTENETLLEQVSEQQREARKAEQHVQLMETGTYEAIEELVKERDLAWHNADDLRGKLDTAAKKARRQDEDALRAQGMWEQEKESWDNERRQFERRIHVTENRLRVFVDVVSAQQAIADAQGPLVEDMGDVGTFKDSGLGNESDSASIKSVKPVNHKRNRSSMSFVARSLRNSASTRASVGTLETNAKPNGYTLADELGIDEEDEYDLDEFEHADDELEYPEVKRRTIDLQRSSGQVDADSKAKRVLGLTIHEPQLPDSTPTKAPAMHGLLRRSVDAAILLGSSRSSEGETASLRSINQRASKALPVYVDTGYQPSPPTSPHRKGALTDVQDVPVINEPESIPGTSSKMHTQASRPMKRALEVATRVAASPISPPETPVVINGITWPDNKRVSLPAQSYSSTSTQTDPPLHSRPQSVVLKRNSLSPPSFVPAIAIHPPTSRPSSPRTYVLPPGTKNASTQASRPWPAKDACVQTEEIRVDKRLRRLMSDLQLSRPSLLPSPPLPDRTLAKRPTSGGMAILVTNALSKVALPSPPVQSSVESSPETPRNHSHKDLRNLPLRAIPLGRPVLAPARQQHENTADGPLNRASQYGVTRPIQSNSSLGDIDKDSDASEYDEAISDADPRDLPGSIPAFSKAPHGRFALSGPPKVVPEDKEISPDRRPGTAGSYGAAPAPSIASSRVTSQRIRAGPPVRLNASRDPRSRSPSFGSASSTYSLQPALPPFAIPRRSSSRVVMKTASEGSQSPTPNPPGGDIFGRAGHVGARTTQHARQQSLRKIQSAAIIRPATHTKVSPRKGGRRKRSPTLTPIQSMAFETVPTPTKFPIPGLPTPLREHQSFDLVKGSVDLSKRPSTAATQDPQTLEETNLIDAIAATMVGEWMWKYVRKRKSFGIAENTNDFPHESSNGAVSVTGHGTRHKRWVWLSPYERTIMWDSKQPTSGSALMGKKGRKLTIQSVLDVQDNTPLPKGAELSSAFNRSILILTPQRALKFTTVSHTRHELWMNALSFLAQSGRLPAQFPAIPPIPSRPTPPIPTEKPLSTTRQRSPSFGRATIRDSVRLAKGRRPETLRSLTQPIGSSSRPTTDMYPPASPHDAAADSGADFPSIPRLYITTSKHQRKRSNTSPRLPAPLSTLRSFSSNAAVPSSSANSSSRLHPLSITASSSAGAARTSSSKSGSRRDSSIASPVLANFGSSEVGVGTVRMEAFVDPSVRDGVLYVPAPPPLLLSSVVLGAQGLGQGQGQGQGQGGWRRRGDSNLSQSTADKRRAGYVFDEYGLDPFKGF